MSAPIGALRARVRLECPVVGPDGATAWDEMATVWAAFGLSDDGCRFELRGPRDVRAGWRVALGDRRFRIRGVRDGDDRGARLLLECEEEAS